MSSTVLIIGHWVLRVNTLFRFITLITCCANQQLNPDTLNLKRLLNFIVSTHKERRNRMALTSR